jgi:transposase
VQRAWDRYDRLSVLGAAVLSPSRRRIDTPFQIQEENVRTPDVVAFIKQLRKRHRRPLIICWDRWSVHRSAHKQIAASRMKGIHFEFLPAYAPELNPVEACWSHAKYADLANFVPDDVSHLKRQVRASLKNHKSDHPLKQSFFKTAQLRL